jgi:transcriptional regulator with XRE-family HTH domain
MCVSSIMADMTSRAGGQDRISTKTKLARELVVLGRVLARAREQAGVKQTEAAAALGLPPSYMSKVENGTRRLDVIEFLSLAKAIGSDPAELVESLRRELESAPPPSR